MTQSLPAENNGGVLVTVIVPVFNTRTELVQRAVGSALTQTHPSLELLIIDDGSSAKTASFLDHLAERDPRIRVIHQANGGLSAARNTGIKHALGNYIAYLDADDYLEPGFLSSALKIAQNTDADVVFGGIRVLHESGSAEWRAGGPSATEPLLGTGEMIVNACVRALSDSPSPHQSTNLLSVTNVVSALHRTHSARQHLFIEGLSLSEDRLYNLSLLLGATRVAFCSDVWYVYDQTHDEGLTRRATPRTITALTRTIREFAAVKAKLSGRALSTDAHDRIVQAASDGVLNYLKVLTGVIAILSGKTDNGLILRSLLREPSVQTAVSRAQRDSWKDHLFAAAAYRGKISMLLILGRLWVRSGGLVMSATGGVKRESGKKS